MRLYGGTHGTTGSTEGSESTVVEQRHATSFRDVLASGKFIVTMETPTDYGLDQTDYEANVAMGFHWTNGVWQFFTDFGYPGDHYMVFDTEPAVGVESTSLGTLKASYK